MMKACPYCGKIHAKGQKCDKKPKKSWIGDQEIRQFRNSQQWITKRDAIKERDQYLCQACLHCLYGTTQRITTDGLSVHHILPLAKSWELRMEDSNLITLCPEHHRLAERGIIGAKQLREIIKHEKISPQGENDA